MLVSLFFLFRLFRLGGLETAETICTSASNDGCYLNEYTCTMMRPEPSGCTVSTVESNGTPIFMMTKQCSTVISLSVSALYTIQVCSETGNSSKSCCNVETTISSGYLTNLYIGNTQVPTCTSAANSQSTSLPNSLHTSSVHVTTYHTTTGSSKITFTPDSHSSNTSSAISDHLTNGSSTITSTPDTLSTSSNAISSTSDPLTTGSNAASSKSDRNTAIVIVGIRGSTVVLIVVLVGVIIMITTLICVNSQSRRNRQSTDPSAIESINQQDPVLMKRNDSYFAIHVQPSTGGVSRLPQVSTSPERVYDIPITLTNETDQLVAEHHDYFVLDDSMLKNKDQYDHELDSSSAADIPKYASLHQRIIDRLGSYSYACICGTSMHAKDSPEHGKNSQVSFKQTNPDFFKSANEISAKEDTNYTPDEKDFGMPQNTSMIHSDQCLMIETNHEDEQPEPNVICNQFELKDLNSVHVFEPLDFQQLEHSQSSSGSNDNPNSASIYSQLQHHIDTQHQKKNHW